MTGVGERVFYECLKIIGLAMNGEGKIEFKHILTPKRFYFIHF